MALVDVFRIGGKVALIDQSDGTTVLASDEEASKLISAGSHFPQTQAAHEARLQRAKYDRPWEAAGRGALEMLTMGRSASPITSMIPDDVLPLEMKLERRDKEREAALLRQNNPWATFGGQALGAVLPLGAGGVGRAMTDAGRGVLSRSMVEGAAFSLVDAAAVKPRAGIMETLSDAAKGAGLGAAFGVVGLGLGSAGKFVWGKVTRLPKKAQALAGEAAALRKRIAVAAADEALERQITRAGGGGHRRVPSLTPDEIMAAHRQRVGHLDPGDISPAGVGGRNPWAAPPGQRPSGAAGAVDEMDAMLSTPGAGPPTGAGWGASGRPDARGLESTILAPTEIVPGGFPAPQPASPFRQGPVRAMPSGMPGGFKPPGAVWEMPPRATAPGGIPARGGPTGNQIERFRLLVGDPRVGPATRQALEEAFEAGVTKAEMSSLISRARFDIGRAVDNLLPVVEPPPGLSRKMLARLREYATDQRLPDPLRKRAMAALDDLDNLRTPAAEKIVSDIDDLHRRMALDAELPQNIVPTTEVPVDIPPAALRPGATGPMAPVPTELAPRPMQALRTGIGIQPGRRPPPLEGPPGPPTELYRPPFDTGPFAAPRPVGTELMPQPTMGPLPHGRTGPMRPLPTGPVEPPHPGLRGMPTGPPMGPGMTGPGVFLPPAVRDLQSQLARKMRELHKVRAEMAAPMVSRGASEAAAALLGGAGGYAMAGAGGGFGGAIMGRWLFYRLGRALAPRGKSPGAGRVLERLTPSVMARVESAGASAGKSADLLKKLSLTAVLTNDEYEQVGREMRAQSKQELAAGILAALDGADPELAGRIVRHNVKAQELFKDTLGPAPETTGDMFGGASSQPTMQQRVKASRVIRASLAPHTAIVNFLDGRLTQDEVSTLEALYGKDFEDVRGLVRTSVTRHVAAGGTYPLAQQDQIKLFLGEPLTGGLRDPELQVMMHPPVKDDGAPPSRGGRFNAPDLASRSQKLEGMLG